MGALHLESQNAGRGRGGLSEAQELLLMRYFDGECSWFQRIRAERLLRGSHHARGFLDTLECASSGLRELCDTSGERAWTDSRVSAPVDVWARISDRVLTERIPSRAERFEARESRLFSGSREFVARLQWGLSGAALAGIVAAFVIPVSQGGVSQDEGDRERLAFNAPATSAQRTLLMSPIRFEDQALRRDDYYTRANRVATRGEAMPELYLPPELIASLSQRSRVNSQPYPRALEVDWMRSRGRVRVMHDPEERTSIIWIKRPEPELEESFDVRPYGRAPVQVLEAASSSSNGFDITDRGGR